MTFMNNLRKIEEIKHNNNNYLEQEAPISEVVSNLSKVVIDSDIINNTFSALIKQSLSRSDLNFFSKVETVDEYGEIIKKEYISDATGLGDCFSIEYQNANEIKKFCYQNSDNNLSVQLEKEDDHYSITRYIVCGNKVLKTKSLFVKKDDMFYQKSLYRKLMYSEDNCISFVKEKYNYDIESDRLIKSYSVVTKEEDVTLSKSSIKTVVDKSDYVVDNNCFHVINRGTDKLKIKKLLINEKELIDIFY